MNYAIIVAAGRGVRMRSDRPKQYLQIGRRPILFHTLKAFDQSRAIDCMIIVVPGDDIEFCRKHIIAPAGLRAGVRIVSGGARRQDSVCNGLGAIAEKDGVVLIHDGVRPLVTKALIDACIQGAEKWGACIPALTPVDTVKRVKDGVVERTLPRDNLRLVQTPQAFQLSLIRKAHREAKANGLAATDDASLVESMGEDVHVISGNQHNIKITTPFDLELAEHYLSIR